MKVYKGFTASPGLVLGQVSRLDRPPLVFGEGPFHPEQEKQALEDAIQLAQKKGVRIVILTGGNSHAIQVRYENLGVEDIFMGCSVKIKTYEEFKQKYSITDEEIIYVGDDIPDYEIMRRCGCPCCPADACSDIKEISTYISACNGGDGVGRDVVEQVLRAKGLWLSDAKAFGW